MDWKRITAGLAGAAVGAEILHQDDLPAAEHRQVVAFGVTEKDTQHHAPEELPAGPAPVATAIVSSGGTTTTTPPPGNPSAFQQNLVNNIYHQWAQTQQPLYTSGGRWAGR